MQNTQPTATIAPTVPESRSQRISRERLRLAAGLKPSARDLFAFLRPRLLDSRPILEPGKYERREILVGGKLRTRSVQVKPVKYGAPTFRNVIDETGKHV